MNKKPDTVKKEWNPAAGSPENPLYTKKGKPRKYRANGSLKGPIKAAQPFGEKRTLKLRTSEERKEAYYAYCDWLSAGNNKYSWVYHKDGTSICYNTLLNYFKKYPDDFDMELEKIALANCLEVWERRGMDMMLGEVPKCQPAIYQMFMRNKFDWDKETRIKDEGKCAAEDILDMINGRLPLPNSQSVNSR